MIKNKKIINFYNEYFLIIEKIYEINSNFF